jgi:hypothetical protein
MVRSLYMAIVEIVLYLQVTAASRGRIIVLVLLNALDASLLVSMIYLTRLVRTLKNVNTASPGIMTTTVQTTQPVAPRPPELSAQTHPQTSVAGAVHPVPVHEVPAYNSKCALSKPILPNKSHYSICTSEPHSAAAS